MPVFGADPDASVTAWSEYEGQPRMFASKPVNALTTYFGYHPSMRMSQVFGDEDKTVLNAFFSRKLKQGHTDRSLKKMVDRFWQSWGADSSRPAYTFTSNKVQQELIKEAEIVKDDPILSWLLDGMPNSGPFEDSSDMRKIVLKFSDEGVLRYPDVVADLIRADNGNEQDRLWFLENVIGLKLGTFKEEDLADEWVVLGLYTTLPKELTSRRSTRIRPRRDTVQEAIANIPLHTQLKW